MRFVPPESVAEEDVACMVDGSAGGDDRERRALQFLEQMCTDHFGIDELWDQLK